MFSEAFYISINQIRCRMKGSWRLQSKRVLKPSICGHLQTPDINGLQRPIHAAKEQIGRKPFPNRSDFAIHAEHARRRMAGRAHGFLRRDAKTHGVFHAIEQRSNGAGQCAIRKRGARAAYADCLPSERIIPIRHAAGGKRIAD